MSTRRTLFVLVALLWGANANAESPHVVSIHAHDDHFEAPARIPSGLTAIAFHNKGWKEHRLRILRLGAGTESQTLAGLRPGPDLPPGTESLGGTGRQQAEGQQVVVLNLTPGRYALVCDLADGTGSHASSALVQPLEVLRYATGTLPAGDFQLTLLDGDLVAPGAVVTGNLDVRIENRTGRPQGLAIARLRRNRSVADARAWLDSREGRAPFRTLTATPPLSAGAAVLLPVALPDGDYLLYEPDEDAQARPDGALLQILAARTER